MLTIALFVASRFFFFGVLIALLVVGNTFVMPLFKGISFLATGPRLQRKRPQAVTVTLAVLLVITGCLFMVPAPRWPHVTSHS